MKKIKIFLLPIFALITLIVNLIQPLHSFKINVSILVMLSLFLIWLIWYFKQKPKVIGLVFLIYLIPFYPLLNNSKIETNTLKRYYLVYLRDYENTHYVWGGEGYFGIDCSGLPRSSFIKANFKYAYCHFNGKALRKAIWLWWHDASAKEILKGFKGATIVDPKIYKISDIRKDIQPGDMATNGSHVMVYLSENEIIQSDPDRNKVVIDQLPAFSHWYRLNVNLVKWNFD